MLGGIGVDGLVAAAVNSKVRLFVAIDVQRRHVHRALDGRLPDRGGYRPSMPLDRLRPADVYGDHTHRCSETHARSTRLSDDTRPSEALKHRVRIARCFRDSLQDVPMLDDLTVLIETENVDAGPRP